MGRGISTTRQMSRGLRGNTCDATKDRGIELRGKILKILRGKKKKGVENSQAVTRQ